MLKAFVVVCFALNISTASELSLLYDYEEKMYYCLTNTSSALALITKFHSDYIEGVAGNIAPHVAKYIDLTKELKHPWMLQNSLTGNVSHVILDHRWEKFPILGNDAIIYTECLGLNNKRCVIPFSVRTKDSAPIVLCNSTSLNEQCDKPQLIDTNLKNNKISHSYVSEEEWSHFILKKIDDDIRIETFTHRPIWVSEPDKLHNISQIRIKRRYFTLWKTHNVTYMYTEKEIEYRRLGTTLKPHNGQICISLLAAMCQGCNLKLKVQDVKSSAILRQIGGENTVTGWQEIKFTIYNITSEVTLFFSTVGGGKGKFWAVDSLRQCTVPEYRYYKSNLTLPCHLLGTKTKKIDQVYKASATHGCPLVTFGKSCIPCRWVFGRDCPKLIVCDEDLECSCSTGSPFNNCTKICDFGTYGFNCSNKCDKKCEDTCSPYDGTCPDCKGQYCNYGREYYEYSTKFTVANVTSERAVIQIPKFSRKYDGNGRQPSALRMRIQYRSRYNLTWTVAPTVLLENREVEKSTTLEFLNECTEYYVRIVLREDVDISNLPFIKLKTECLPQTIWVLYGSATLIIFMTIILLIISLLVWRRCRSKRLTRPPTKIRELIPPTSRSKTLNLVSNHQFVNYVRCAIDHNTLGSKCLTILSNSKKEYYDNVKDNLILEFLDLRLTDTEKIRRAYLIADFPKRHQIEDFWNLIWDEHVKNIILIESPDNYVYWSDHTKLSFRRMSVQLLSKKTFADHDHRKFLITKEKQIRQVDHYCFISWSDTHVHQTGLTCVPLLQKTTKICINSHPLLVHCRLSPLGVGFYLLCDMTLRIAQKTGVINVDDSFKALVKLNTNIVNENTNLFVLSHLVVVEYLSFLDTSITKTNFKQQLEYLEKTQWLDAAMRSVQREDSVYYKTSRRGVRLVSYMPEQNPYFHILNAVHVTGCRNSHFIVTPKPSDDTLATFWSMLNTEEISVVVSLHDFDFWSQLCTFEVVHKEDYGFYDCVTLRSKFKSETTLLVLRLKDGIKIVDNFISFCLMSEEFLKPSSRVVVTCGDGVTSSGLYLAMMYLLKKQKLEKVYDVCTAVRMVRCYKSEFLKNQEQIGFLYDCAYSFLRRIANKSVSPGKVS